MNNEERQKEVTERVQKACSDSSPELIAITNVEDKEGRTIYYFGDNDEGRIIRVTDDENS